MSKVQAVTFDKSIWSTADARAWLDKHGFARIKPVHKSASKYRYRVREPISGANYATKDIGHGIQLVIEFPPQKPGRRQYKKRPAI